MSAAGYELYYWPTIQGRGEFVRLALEAAGAAYVDVARSPGGMAAMMKILKGGLPGPLPFAVPFLRHGDRIVSQSAAILAYLGPLLGLAPEDEQGRSEALQIQLTLADLVTETHDTHHPISSGLYYEEQKAAAKARSAAFVSERVPKFLGWLERVLVRGGGEHLVAGQLTYVDLSAFQVLSGLFYAFPNAMARLRAQIPRLLALHDRVQASPRLKAYLTSSRRLPFNEQGIFRRYPELDLQRQERQRAQRSLRARSTPRGRSAARAAKTRASRRK
ncbi:MAG TPA: glutathione S-transferase [Polyangiaceae bacterium]|nr:glutathione S-transferase [Polyangiaceae bacterium]